MLGARACRLSAETGASSSASQSTRKGEGSVAKWSPTELMHRWKIMTLKMMMVIRVYAIKLQAQAVLGKENYFRVLADVRDQDHTTRAQSSTMTRIIGGYLVGTPLSRGQGPAKFSPDQCNHPSTTMKPRGNKNQQWFTCMQCQARWERNGLNHQGKDPNPQDLVGFGMYSHMTYAEVIRHHPRYCDWVLETMEQEADYQPLLGRFGTFLLLERHLQTPLSQDEMDAEGFDARNPEL